MWHIGVPQTADVCVHIGFWTGQCVLGSPSCCWAMERKGRVWCGGYVLPLISQAGSTGDKKKAREAEVSNALASPQTVFGPGTDSTSDHYELCTSCICSGRRDERWGSQPSRGHGIWSHAAWNVHVGGTDEGLPLWLWSAQHLVILWLAIIPLVFSWESPLPHTESTWLWGEWPSQAHDLVLANEKSRFPSLICSGWIYVIIWPVDYCWNFLERGALCLLGVPSWQDISPAPLGSGHWEWSQYRRKQSIDTVDTVTDRFLMTYLEHLDPSVPEAPQAMFFTTQNPLLWYHLSYVQKVTCSHVKNGQNNTAYD